MYAFLSQRFISVLTVSLLLRPQSVKASGIVEMEAMKIKSTPSARVSIPQEKMLFKYCNRLLASYLNLF